LDVLKTQEDKDEQAQAVLLAVAPLLFAIEAQLTQTPLIVTLLPVLQEQTPLVRVKGEGQ
jgi:hypothetical protein